MSSIPNNQKTVDTFHLGLFRSLGGRLTLVEDGKRKLLVFCGIPREKLEATRLYKTYKSMQVRTGVLTRDWCLAATEISNHTFEKLKLLFANKNQQEIENYVCADIAIHLKHYCTFLIDNPVKPGAEKFISNFLSIKIPVFVATGDTAKAAENIASVLCPNHINQITTMRAATLPQWGKHDFTRASTLIFAGINDEILRLFDQIMLLPIDSRPIIIFAEMSTKDKGTLALHLKNKGYFVVANGDGSNDIDMMKHAHMVIAHLNEDGNYAAEVEQFANLNDAQLSGPFYEAFDIHKPHSHFQQKFIRLANAQENPSKALLLKTTKMGFELAPALGVKDIREMPHQHWFSVGFDLLWLLESFLVINSNTDSPSDNKHLGISNYRSRTLIFSTIFAAALSWFNYENTGETTNLTTMMGMLLVLPLVLNSVFNTFGAVRDDIHPQQPREHKAETSKRRFGLFRNCLRGKKEVEVKHQLLKQ